MADFLLCVSMCLTKSARKLFIIWITCACLLQILALNKAGESNASYFRIGYIIFRNSTGWLNPFGVIPYARYR